MRNSRRGETYFLPSAAGPRLAALPIAPHAVPRPLLLLFTPRWKSHLTLRASSSGNNQTSALCFVQHRYTLNTKRDVSILVLIIYPLLVAVRNTSAFFARRPWCRRPWNPPVICLFIYRTIYTQLQRPVEPCLYPHFPPALISNAIPQRVKLPETSPHSQWFMFNLYKWRKWDFKFQCHFCNEVIKRERGIAFYCIEYWSHCYFP